MRVAALIVAAGRGSRLAGADRPKQYLPLAGTSILGRTLDLFIAHPAITLVQCVIHPDDHELYVASIGERHHRCRQPVHGGSSRQDSVLAGLEALEAARPDAVLIHDAARPLTPPSVIDAVLAALAQHPGAIAARPVTDTLKQQAASGVIARTHPRDGLWHAETPQGFIYPAILEAHRRAAASGIAGLTDDAAVAEWAGLAVALVPTRGLNIKITTAEDLDMAERHLAATVPADETRTGTGFDVHRFKAGDHVWLGGVRIPHTHGVEGHSDADVALHALTDALLGAIGDGDIGQHFPPSDPRWKGAPSHLFLADAARRIAGLGGSVVNVDVTILCEAPRVSPHREAMRRRIAEILDLSPARVGVKATTTEGMGFTGRGEGLAAMATASVRLPAGAAN